MPRPLAAFLEEKLGTKATPFTNPLNVASVGVTATRVLGFNPNRYALIFVNLSLNTIYAFLDNTVTASKGIAVGASGGGFSLVAEEDFELVSQELWCLATGPASAFLVYSVDSAGA